MIVPFNQQELVEAKIMFSTPCSYKYYPQTRTLPTEPDNQLDTSGAERAETS